MSIVILNCDQSWNFDCMHIFLVSGLCSSNGLMDYDLWTMVLWTMVLWTMVCLTGQWSYNSQKAINILKTINSIVQFLESERSIHWHTYRRTSWLQQPGRRHRTRWLFRRQICPTSLPSTSHPETVNKWYYHNYYIKYDHNCSSQSLT